jgi:prepilin-type N-terminal cleavage/methylation domain-containing protein
MHIQFTEFDRTLSKTSKSRSIKFARSKSSGFTLIELLVVISIIALLSTLILSGLQNSRVKARNTAKNNLILEYTKALELYQNDNGKYPSAGTGSETIPKCIGYAETGDKCFASTYDGSNTINSAFSTYIKGDISHRGKVPYGNYDLKGVQYKCEDATCNSYILIWYNENQNQKCISDTTGISTWNNTKCEYTKR